jgi:hypothetical protein
MKRSEMIDILDNALLTHTDIGASCCNLNINKETLHLVLCALEAAGMQPPAIQEPCETFVLHNGKYVKTEDSFVFTNKWEEE